MLPFGEECTGLVDVLMCKIKRHKIKMHQRSSSVLHSFICKMIRTDQNSEDKLGQKEKTVSETQL